MQPLARFLGGGHLGILFDHVQTADAAPIRFLFVVCTVDDREPLFIVAAEAVAEGLGWSLGLYDARGHRFLDEAAAVNLDDPMAFADRAVALTEQELGVRLQPVKAAHR
jgi:hypothetical protein